MKTETLYELLKDYEDPCIRIAKGVRKTEHKWMTIFPLLNPNDCEIKDDWFKPVKVPIYNEEDLVEFANYIINRSFPKEDTGNEVYLKWKTIR
jgi:hypothetical protein